MAFRRKRLSADEARFGALLRDALESLPAGDLNQLFQEISGAYARAKAANTAQPLMEFLESIAITHALHSNEDYRLAVKDVEAHAHEEPNPVDVAELRERYATSA